mmetsp:Transcript_13917/g.23175  ORF Transcript_13917/g.23175 Transcript_13917/m.23175 type:complete len:239 (-) Transcript_13917:1470-2186(-)
MGDCCSLKRGSGKCLVFFFTIAFAIGVVVACSAPSWISFAASLPDADAGQTLEIHWGPFYGQSRVCSEVTGSEEDDCTKWKMKTIDLSDCEAIPETTESDDVDLAKLCTRLTSWRSLAVVCLILVVIGGCFVFAGSCCQALTCACCGNSMDAVANVLFWFEVVLSIAAWSLCINSLSLIRNSPSVTETSYEWAFWVFVVFGTIIGGVAATMADWAAEGSCLRWFFRCITCRKKDDDDK